MEQEDAARKQLVRDAKREALTRIEDAARTLDDFKNVIKQWDHLDDNREHRERDNEIGRAREEMLHWTEGEDGEIRTELEVVIPRPLEHEWWRQLIRGDFLDVIFDCPHELHELTSNELVSDVLKTLNENQREVLYYRVIRQYKPKRIAKLRGQSARNILKVYDTLLKGLQKKLYIQLESRLAKNQPLTNTQQQFTLAYISGEFDTGKVKRENVKNKSVLDSGNVE